MKPLVVSAAVLVIPALALVAWTSPQPLTFEAGGRIWVEGTSTVGAWTCEAGTFSGTLAGSLDGGALASLHTATVSIPVARMDCGGRLITADMREALKAAAHPSIEFRLSSASVGAPNNGLFAIDTRGQLTVAGVTREVRFMAQGRVLADGRFRLTGSVPMQMTQYGITPPTAMLGILRTRDAITVRFDVTIRG